MQVVDRSTPFAPSVLLAVGVGGAIGATGRWLTAWIFGSTGAEQVPGAWPWATLLVNLLGCVAIGVAARRIGHDTRAWAFVVTGVLGGFTTFSALAVELNDMADAGRMPLAIAYGALTLAGGVAATMIADAGRRQP